MAFADTITTVGNKIIALVGTRAKTDLSNITSDGEDVIRDLAGGGSGVPVGTVIAYMGTTEPDGYLLMDGRVLSQETYADLYSVIGVSQLPSGATESGGVYTWTGSNGITYSTGAGTDDATHKYKMFAIADMTDGRYLMGSTVAGTRKVAGIPNITGSPTVAYSYLGDGWGEDKYSGAFHSWGYGSGELAVGTGFIRYHFDLSAARCSSVYGNSSTVTPLSISTKYIVKF